MLDGHVTMWVEGGLASAVVRVHSPTGPPLPMENEMRLAAAIILPFALGASPVCSQGELPDADWTGAFQAAGFKQVAGDWRACEAPLDSIYTPGQIEQVRDLNEDGLPEAIITEGSNFCYGGDEVGFWLVSKQTDSSWKLVLASPGIATILDETGAQGWPDIEVGGQGFCFPVQRWNGTEYEFNRFQYEGEVCDPDG